MGKVATALALGLLGVLASPPVKVSGAGNAAVSSPEQDLTGARAGGARRRSTRRDGMGAQRCQNETISRRWLGAAISCGLAPEPQTPAESRTANWAGGPGANNTPRGSLCYASAGGHDTADGSTWNNAKESLMACYDSLGADGGTVFFTDGGVYSGSQVRACPRNDPPGCGIWIMGRKDPNFAHPPPGWRRAKRTIIFVGVGGVSFGANSRFGGKPGVLAGSGVDRNHPSIWLSDVSGVVFRNMATFSAFGIQPLRGIVVGEGSDHNRRGAATCASVVFDNVDPSVYGDLRSGPGIDITGGSFWITIQNSLVNGSYGQPREANGRAAILIDGSGNNGNGLIFISDTNVNAGGIKYVPGLNPGSLVVRNLTLEGDFVHDVPPAVWLSNGGTVNGTTLLADDITVSDPGPNGAPALQIDGGLADNCTAMGISGAGHPNAGVNVRGPCTIVGQFESYNLAASNDSISPLRRGQAGTVLGHLIGQTDAARRAFPPTAVRFPNLALQSPSVWVASQYQGGASLLPGVLAPDGTRNAGRASNHGGKVQECLWFTGGNGHLRRSVRIGDWFIMGAWVRSATANGYSESNTQALAFDIDDAPRGSLEGTRSTAPNRGDGEWEWQWIAEKVVAVPRADVYVQFSAHFDEAHSLEAFAPILLHIPAQTISDNEAYDLAVNLQSYPDSARVGDISTLRNERLSIGGTTEFFAKLTHSCTRDCVQTFPDAAGPNALAATNLEQQWQRRQDFRGGSAFGGGTVLARYARYTSRLTPAAVPANSCTAQSFTVPGLLKGDVLIGVSKPSEQNGLTVAPGHVAGDGSGTVNFCNVTAAAIAPRPREDYDFVVVQ